MYTRNDGKFLQICKLLVFALHFSPKWFKPYVINQLVTSEPVMNVYVIVAFVDSKFFNDNFSMKDNLQHISMCH